LAELFQLIGGAGGFASWNGDAMRSGFPDMGGGWAPVQWDYAPFDHAPSWLRTIDGGAFQLTEAGKYIVEADVNWAVSINSRDNPYPAWDPTGTGGRSGDPENTPTHPDGMFVIVKHRLTVRVPEFIGT
jgi:hypothetical protein